MVARSKTPVSVDDSLGSCVLAVIETNVYSLEFRREGCVVLRVTMVCDNMHSTVFY